MDNTAYKPPESDLGDVKIVDVPDDILRKIRNGWIAAVISGIMTLLVTVFVFQQEFTANLVQTWVLFDVVLIFGMAVGIFMKSRVAATLMFLYFLGSKILVIVQTGQFSGAIMSLVFLYFYFQAMMGSFEYHSWIKAMSPNDE